MPLLSQHEVEAITAGLHDTGRPVWVPRELGAFVTSHSEPWMPQRKVSSTRVLSFLVKSGVLQHHTVKSDHYNDVARISITSLAPSAMEVATSLRSNAYLSHASAASFHGLTDQSTKTIFVNKEQSPKPPPTGEMTQDSINRAFSRPQRASRHTFRIADHRVVLLAGKSTNRLGVQKAPDARLMVTCLERTLIDITVRPRYAGGVFQVTQAFKSCAERVSIDALVTMLAQMEYRYPYHQALGFYLERAGVSPEHLQPLRHLGLEFKFYLDYSMASPSFDSSWRVFHPRGV